MIELNEPDEPPPAMLNPPTIGVTVPVRPVVDIPRLPLGCVARFKSNKP